MHETRSNPNTPIAIFAILFLISAALCAGFYFKLVESQKKWDNLQSKNIVANKELDTAKNQLCKISNLVGFYAPGGQLGSDSQTIISKLEYFTNEQSGLGLNLNAQKIDEEQLFSRDYIKNVTKLETIWEKCAKRIEELQKKIEEMQNTLKEEQTRYGKETQNTVAEINRLENSIQEKRKKLEDVRKEYEDRLKKQEEERNLAQVNNLQHKEKLADTFRTRRIQKHKVESELENLEERINELKAEAAGQTGIERWFQEQTAAQKVQESPDGEIIHVDQKLQTAYIDLGLSTGVLKGIPFQVFRYGKGGAKEYKGKVVVKNVEDTISMVGIIETNNPLDPIVAGDKIINPVYDRNKVRYFVIAGRLGKYSLEQASRLVEKLGGKIEKEISARTDFVVLGDGFKKDTVYQTATDRGIETMLESEFLSYLGD
jgi:NAD-dependent DNA ligase